MGDPLIFIRAIHFAATLTLAGALIFAAAVVGPIMRSMERGGEALRARLLRIAWWSFAAALISGMAWLVVLAADINERAPSEAFFGGIVWTVLLHTTFGHDWLARLVLAALLAAALGWISPKHLDLRRWAIAALLASAFAAAAVHSGHAAATAGWLGTFHRAADGLHLIAASAWLGGLLPLALLLTAARREGISLALAREATLRFSTLGLISVGVLIATGSVNGWILTGSVPALIGTDYGRLLLAKVALFLAMVAIAAINRLRLTPRLALTVSSPRCGEALLHERNANGAPAAARTALRALARNSVMEAMFGLAILVIVGALGTTPPGLHVLQPTWPFAVRYSDAAFGDAELRGRLALAMWAIGGGLLCGALLTLIGAKARRAHPRLTPWLIAAGTAVAIACIAHFAPTLTLATVEAYPTSFYIAPTGYSASSIVRGAKLFATHCASCHGREGRGDGPAGRFLRVKPSDLTADHVYAHTDGDLYWWIANGIREVMPPFAVALDEGRQGDQCRLSGAGFFRRLSRRFDGVARPPARPRRASRPCGPRFDRARGAIGGARSRCRHHRDPSRGRGGRSRLPRRRCRACDGARHVWWQGRGPKRRRGVPDRSRRHVARRMVSRRQARLARGRCIGTRDRGHSQYSGRDPDDRIAPPWPLTAIA
ncbi:MAG: copper homeostasis membrane protein CopD [Alphaproteobacteria bacterium]|nr:MAG: copper homeostasis membrane protein CopD [Alphaproteobacteria bacterium]